VFHQAKAFVLHWLNEVGEHSIHSPYFFDFYRKVILGRTDPLVYAEIEKLRSNMLVDQTLLAIEDLGAGSAVHKSDRRSIADIAHTSISSRRRAELYTRIAAYCNAKRIVELGSGLGVTALYLAQQKESHIFTFEGSPALINVSLTNFEYFNQQNIRLIEGNIDVTLGDFLQDPAKLNFVLMDANHRYAATIRYFNQLVRRMNERSLMVVDDIHWSAEMEKAWEELRHHELVYGSADLFGCGILFFDPTLTRQHYIWPRM
jgi:predicted O-methyltransferase YrrM